MFSKKLISIDSPLYNYTNSNAGYDGSVFKDYINLKSIHKNLFKNLTLTTASVYNNLNLTLGCFDGCSSLESIPLELFNVQSIIDNSINFSACFRNCSSLTFIPARII